MQHLYKILIIAFGLLLAYNIITKTRVLEGMDNDESTCDSIKTMVYKNAGNISSIQDRMDKIMKQVNKIILSDDRQTTQIQQMQGLEKKYDALAEQADQLANENKQRLIAMAKQNHAKMQNASKESDKIKFK